MSEIVLIVVVVLAVILYQRRTQGGNNDSAYYEDDYHYEEQPMYQQPIVQQPSEVTHYHKQVDVKGKKRKGNLVCPKCRSVNVDILDNSRKGFSVGKAVVGGALTMGVGSLAGFLGKKNKKPLMRCNNCGNTFKFKLK